MPDPHNKLWIGAKTALLTWMDGGGTRWGRLIARRFASAFSKICPAGAEPVPVSEGYRGRHLACARAEWAFAGSRVVFAVDTRSPHDGASQVECSNVVDAIRRSTAVAPHLGESPYPRPGRDVLAPAREDAGKKYSDQIRQWSRRLAVCGIHSNWGQNKISAKSYV